MLLFARRAEKKPPTKRSRAGCIPCKDKKKKCNEKQPRCDRCVERKIQCEYQTELPRKRRRTESAPVGTNSLQHENFVPFGLNSIPEDALQEWQDPVLYSSTDWNLCLASAETSLGTTAADEPDVEEIVRSLSNSSQPPVSDSSLAMIAPISLASPLLEFRSPLFMEFVEARSRRALLSHFTEVLSPLMVFTEETGNPFQQLLLPMSASSPSLLNAILALSCAHLEYRGIQNEEKSLDFHTLALQELGENIKHNDSGDEILAAIVMLIYYEVLVHRGTSNIVSGHLKGALSIIRSQSQSPSPTNRFLQLALSFFDVIAALSFGTSPHSLTCSPGALSLGSSKYDTLLGMTTELWPIIHEMSNLSNVRREVQAVELSGFHAAATALRSELEVKANAVEISLKSWRPLKRNGMTTASLDFCTTQADSEQGKKIDNRIQSIICNAEAYRQGAFVYLHHNIKGVPRRSSTVQYHAKATLAACLRVVMYEGPMANILWPLFIGACEAVKEVDRVVARTAFREANGRQGMMNIAQAWEVVEEVWRRGDAEAREVCWEEICEDRGFNIVFG